MNASVHRRRVIGVVGGLGPLAGVDLVRKIFDQTIAAKDQDHLDVVLLSHSAEVPDRTEFLIGKSVDNPGEAVGRILLQLDRMNCDIAAIACLTSHAPAIHGRIREKLNASGARIHLIHTVDEVASYSRECVPGGSVGILATNGTVNADIFGRAFRRCSLNAIYPDRDVQNRLVHDAIYHPVHGIKAASPPNVQPARKQLLAAASHLIDKGADAIVLGCTEIPLVIQETTVSGCMLIDPATVVARALVRYAAPEKLRPLVLETIGQANLA